MKIASHNSLTFLPVRKWWMQPFAWMARCQQLTIEQQLQIGVRLFDFRVRFNGTELIPCHGLIEYKLDNIYDYFRMFDRHKDQIYVRIVLESRNPNDNQKQQFREFCQLIESVYTCTRFFGGNDRTDWLSEHPLFKFAEPLEDIDHQYASATTRFFRGPRWLRYIDDLYPKGYARRYNFKNIVKGTSQKWLMLDFVNIQR